MTKFRMYLDKDKETKWLNEMASNGYAMESFFAGFYRFVPCEKDEWQYQIDIGKGFFFVKKSYAEFMKEMDIDIIQSWGPWVIMRRKSRDGEFSLYTDVDSRIAQYKKILLLFKITMVFELLLLFYSVYCGIAGIAYAWAVVCLLCTFVTVFANAIIRTSNTIIKLKEQKDEPSLKTRGRLQNLPEYFYQPPSLQTDIL